MLISSGRLSRRSSTALPVSTVSDPSCWAGSSIGYHLHLTVCWDVPSFITTSLCHQPPYRFRLSRLKSFGFVCTRVDGRTGSVRGQLRNGRDPTTWSIFPTLPRILPPRPPAGSTEIQLRRVWFRHRSIYPSTHLTTFPVRIFAGNRHPGNYHEGQGRTAVPQPRSEAVRGGGTWSVSGFRQRAVVEAEALENAQRQGTRTVRKDGCLVSRPSKYQQIEDLPGPAERFVTEKQANIYLELWLCLSNFNRKFRLQSLDRAVNTRVFMSSTGVINDP